MPNLFADKALLPSGWSDNVRIKIENGAVRSVEADTAMADGDTAAAILIPGMRNAHSHAFQRALAGHTEWRSPSGHDNFWSWRDRMYRLAGSVDASALRAIAAQVYAEMLESGYTSVAEFHYLHRDPGNPDATDAMFEAIAAAAAATGIRLTYVPVHYERAGFDDPEPLPHQKNFVQSVDEFLAHVERAAAAQGPIVGMGAHSLRAVSPGSLQEIAAVAREKSRPMHIHVAEQLREVDDCLAAHGRRPIRWLLENFDVDHNWCVVHATHLDDEEIAELADSDAVVALCPSTEANLGDGLFPLRAFLAAGGRIAIGSDSHVSINPFEELRWLEYGQRLASHSRNIAALDDSHVGSELFQRTLSGGAAACGQHLTGVTAGAAADFVELSEDDAMLAGHGDESRLDALVFSGYPVPINRVMVDGRWTVVDGAHVEKKTIRAAYGDALAAIGDPS